MMISRISSGLSDICCIFHIRMKLICKDYITLAVLFGSVILFSFLVRALSISAEDMSSLPIGVVDYDNSNSSRELILGLKQVDTLRVIGLSEKDLKKLLMDEMITSIFIIEKDYEKNLMAGNLNGLISMYYKEDNKSASVIADIVAGEMIYPVCFYTSFHYYEKLPYEGQKLSLEQYQSYMDKIILTSEDFNFTFKTHYSNPDTKTAAGARLSNTVLYQQFIFGILGLVMAFIAMFILSQNVKEKENGLVLRLQITRFYILKRDMGNLFALLFWEGSLSLIFTFIVFYQVKIMEPRLWLSSYLLLLLNASVLGELMLLLTKVIRRMLSYQVFVSIFILITGGLGFYHLLQGFYQSMLDNVVKFIPNSWFIKGFTDIIIYGSQLDTLTQGHRILMIMAVVLLLLLILIDLLQEKHIIKLSKNRTGR
ncbi:MAG TPA: ABC transporter permease [Mobilitalea sp.]|nr:ABC transporter permease [Mobilitalea sp.]